MKSNLLNILIKQGLISERQAAKVLEQQNSDADSITELLISSNTLSADSIATFLSNYLNEPIVDIYSYEYQQTSEKIGQKNLFLSKSALPLEVSADKLVLAVSDPLDFLTHDEISFATNLKVKPVIADHHQLMGAIRKLYGRSVSRSSMGYQSNVSNSELAELANVDGANDDNDLFSDDAPVSRFIQQVLLDAIGKHASDIHFEPFEQSYQIRFRLDGILQTHSTPPAGISRRLSTRLKIIAKLNIAERRLPQDGRIKLNLSEEKSIDMRVSTLPTLWGEKVVLRILDGGSVALDIDSLGYNPQQKQDYLNALNRPQGMILMTGPTGSGKTVSLYTGLKYLNTADRNISTAEDPVEINLPGINQVNINNDIGLDFAKALRAFLRQDPDVVMVGEIRDLETAEIGIKAAQTGHLVLSTLHTNSAAESVTRLANMGVAAYNLAASLTLIIAQRLGRRLCPHCKVPHDVDDHHLTALTQHYPSLKPELVYQASPEGCDHCNHGYLGRVGIYEVMPVSRDLAEAIGNGASASRIETLAMGNGMLTLQLSGIEKLNEGVTSLAELQRVISL
ncbi:type IV-A pilus assembly ATPase PilB [Grimontia sp. S25]|uniref:Type IV-A pilus assembly ATPase PilB n=1 Tax=Grimontia sedimenti TaxID=2711294 RepID=A0A6M1RQ62_9GAMM|nr:type IV-A pilus assembly ATPase PilB [Grimontia sedimenti]NGN98177.1 type IV-A pilus assembly ATPase PilB [Grimontia sedimenti]